MHIFYFFSKPREICAYVPLCPKIFTWLIHFHKTISQSWFSSGFLFTFFLQSIKMEIHQILMKIGNFLWIFYIKHSTYFNKKITKVFIRGQQEIFCQKNPKTNRSSLIMTHSTRVPLYWKIKTFSKKSRNFDFFPAKLEVARRGRVCKFVAVCLLQLLLSIFEK